MKKTYITPEVHTVKVNLHRHLLAGSDEGLTIYGNTNAKEDYKEEGFYDDL